MTQRLLSLAALALFVLLGVGCCPITKLNVSVELDESFRQAFPNRTVTVDIVAVGPNENLRWESYPMSKYWEAGDKTRNSLDTKSLTLDASKKDAQILSASDPIWTKWLAGANEKDPPRIYVLVQLPGTFGPDKDKPGNQDPRRQILPTGSCRWDDSAGKPPTVKLVVKEDRIMTLTSPKPDKGK